MIQETDINTATSERRLHGDYWARAEDGDVELFGYTCTHCGTCYLPAIATCAACRGKDFTRTKLSSTGELYTYTIVRGAGGVWPAEYTVGYVDYPEEKVRVCGQIRETDSAKLKVGMRVGVEQAVLYTAADGAPVTCFRFHALEH
jgi:uncharacterized OB-fold protein